MAVIISRSLVGFHVSYYDRTADKKESFAFLSEKLVMLFDFLLSVLPFVLRDDSTFVKDGHDRRSHLESLFCYDNAIPEERTNKPVGLSVAEKELGNNPRCEDFMVKGAVLCSTCSGSGLNVDAIMESQGIVVKVLCLGCGGTGNIVCSECDGRGYP